jgi:hypothetical protein
VLAKVSVKTYTSIPDFDNSIYLLKSLIIRAALAIWPGNQLMTASALNAVFNRLDIGRLILSFLLHGVRMKKLLGPAGISQSLSERGLCSKERSPSSKHGAE